jgi:hypothetical protein
MDFRNLVRGYEHDQIRRACAAEGYGGELTERIVAWHRSDRGRDSALELHGGDLAPYVRALAHRLAGPSAGGGA